MQDNNQATKSIVLFLKSRDRNSKAEDDHRAGVPTKTPGGETYLPIVNQTSEE